MRLARFRNAAEKIIPDPVSYADWFEQAGEERQRTAVGSRRFNTVAELTTPSWASFIDPETGDLMSLDDLRAESAAERAERINQVQALVNQRREQLRQVQRFGFSGFRFN